MYTLLLDIEINIKFTVLLHLAHILCNLFLGKNKSTFLLQITFKNLAKPKTHIHYFQHQSLRKNVLLVCLTFFLGTVCIVQLYWAVHMSISCVILFFNY